MQVGTFALAVDLGGTKVDAALVAADGEVLAGSVHRAPTGPAATREEIAEAVRRVAVGALAHLGADEQPAGIGIGSAGPVDLASGAVAPLNLPAAAGLPIVALLHRLRPDVPVRLALDGACLALAEHWRGAAKGARNALAMVVSTGVGGGLIIDGELAPGFSGNAGHIGQLRLRGRARGSPPTEGTLESLASGPRTVAWAREQGWRGATGEELARAYGERNPIAVAAVRRSASAVGEAIASVTTLLDLEVAVLGGGFVQVAPDYLDLVRESVADAAAFDYVRRVEVTGSGLSGHGPLVGAAALVLR